MQSATFSLPPLSDHATFPELFLGVARRDTDFSPAILLEESKGTQGGPIIHFRKWDQIICDIHACAEQLMRLSGRKPRAPGSEQLPVGILHHSGYKHFLLFNAALLLRWTPMLISPRNSPAAIVHLLKSANATLVFGGSDIDTHFRGEKLDESLSIIAVPTLYDMSTIPHDQALSQLDRYASLASAIPTSEEKQVAIFMHTSGSTGHPKLIPWTHRTLVLTILSLHTYRPQSIGESMYTTIPVTHGAGLVFTWFSMLGLHGRFVFIESLQPPTAASTLKDLQDPRVGSGEVAFSPSILEEIYDGPLRDPGIEILKRCKVVMATGAPLRPDVGLALSRSGVRILSGLGTTETGSISTFSLHPLQEADDWQYFEFGNTLKIELIPVNDEDPSLREAIIFSGSVPLSVFNRHNPDCHATNDIFQRHPDPKKSMLWKYVGRRDDLIVLSNGLKANTRQLDALLCASPLIEAVALFGSGRFQVGAIILPARDQDGESEAYRDAVWDHVTSSVNSVVPQFARLVRPLLLFATEDKPFFFTDKKTVKIRATISLYQNLIEEAYSSFQRGDADAATLPPGGFSPDDRDSIALFLAKLASETLGRTVEEQDDIFLAGGDSLLAFRIRSSMEAALRRSGASVQLPQNIVYQYPTISSLADVVQSEIARSRGWLGKQVNETTDASIVDASLAVHTQALLRQLDTISESISQVPGDSSVPRTSSVGSVFAITGGTGSLGVFVIRQLLSSATVGKIYLLYRKHAALSALNIFERAFSAKGVDFEPLSEALASGRAIFVEVDISRPRLGLEPGVYTQMASELTHIVHSAWAVNFNLSLKTFEPHIVGVRNIVELALSARSRSPARIFFTSSVAVMGGQPNVALRPAPEQALDSSETCGSLGYGQSKFIAEKLFETACARQPKLSVTIVRAGQLAGSLNGRWSKAEHVPIIMKACTQVGKVPSNIADVRWLPLDIAAEILVSLISQSALHSANGRVAFYHLEAARATPWARVAASICQYPATQGSSELPLVSGEEWLDAIANGPDNAARRLLAFYQSMFTRDYVSQVLGATRMREVAGSLLDFEVDDALLARYVAHACE